MRDGYLFARYTMRLPNGSKDVRRKTLEKDDGRYKQRSDFYRREGCGLLRSHKLERAVFGGPKRRSLGVAFRLTDASRVTVRVQRGSRVVKTLVRNRQLAAGRTHRARLSSRGLRRGTYRIVTTAERADGRSVRSTLFTRKL